MRMTRGWTGLRTSAFVLAIGTLAASAVEASPIVEYNTSGTVDPVTGITSPSGLPNAGGVISFRSIPDTEQPGVGSIDAPSSLSLGQFQVAGLTDGSQVNYK